jgi:hypothetical protein
MTLIDVLIGMLIVTALAAVFLAFLFAGFRMGQASGPQAPGPRTGIAKVQPIKAPIIPTELQEDPYIRALRPPLPKGEVRIPTIEED